MNLWVKIGVFVVCVGVGLWILSYCFEDTITVRRPFHRYTPEQFKKSFEASELINGVIESHSTPVHFVKTLKVVPTKDGYAITSPLHKTYLTHDGKGNSCGMNKTLLFLQVSAALVELYERTGVVHGDCHLANMTSVPEPEPYLYYPLIGCKVETKGQRALVFDYGESRVSSNIQDLRTDLITLWNALAFVNAPFDDVTSCPNTLEKMKVWLRKQTKKINQV
jgi:hypothetical protein